MFLKFGELKPTGYKGIKVLAAYGLHEDLFRIMSPYLKPSSTVLDFGCGEGAFSQRLIDAGMIVDGVDINTAQTKAEHRNRFELDLNTADITSIIKEKYDVVVAMEILEHIHNPWKYLNDCKSVLKEGGIIVLSTPNISAFPSRLRFFMRGTLIAYEKTDLAHGHITPLSFVQLENMFDQFKLSVLKKDCAGPIPIFHFFGLSLFSLLRNTVLPMFYPFMSGPKKGRSLVYVLKKN
jgi:2-polyprenyl-3-methyl-5-hydroxy-6-metoxy-1,4-benzoquinol methylase